MRWVPDLDSPYENKPFWLPKLIWLPFFWLYCAGYAQYVMPHEILLAYLKAIERDIDGSTK